ncbi:dyslexia-associated protein KIAA0319 homolog isoform X2 [Pseudoliparis swirei]|uniref:dyslexia-associated protein KIAA0319 homolog isoform X2 n=1 Tax=Pseudoliparis swirei TaxID=2059687 RepID=UPI0024BD7FC8|nr:dyslexia-associated protein KIAA0319 homolog isoform X2 [Pseudoliparis swirei]
MWVKRILLLLLSVEAVLPSQCQQGATFSEVVLSPAVGDGVLRAPGAASLPQCVAVGCGLPGSELVWLFEGRCYILSCQQGASGRPRESPGAAAFLAFLHRAPPQALGLQSLGRGDPYAGDLEALENLAPEDGPPQDSFDPGMPDAEHPRRSQEERGGPSVEGRDQFTQSETEGGPEGLEGPKRTGSSPAQNRASSRQGDDWRPTTPQETEAPQMFLPLSVSPQQHRQRPPRRTGATRTRAAGTTAQPDGLKVLQSAVRAPPTATHLPDRPLTSDPTTNQSHRTIPPTAATVASGSEVRGSNRGPVAVVGPDRQLLLPMSNLLLDGGGSTDDCGIASYRWDAVSGPLGLKLEGADQAVATASGLRVGRYTFRLTVSDQQGETDRASLTVRVQEATSLPPVAHASGSHTVSLPNSSLVLRGAVTDGDQTEVHYLWVRDSQSPAAGDVLYASETAAWLYLANLVEGTYLFQLRVTDARGRCSTATATVEVRPEPGGGQQVELEMLVSVSQVSVAQRDTLVRQLAALIHVLDRDIRVRALQGHSHLSTVLRFSVRGPAGPISGSRLVVLLGNQLLREKSDYLLFRVLRVETVWCLLRCSGRGRCDPVTKACSCDPFWTENLLRRYVGDGESNCEWRVLFVILTSLVLMVFILSVSWTFICCCRRRRQTRVRKKTKYTILDNMDDQERVELRPKFSIKHRSTEHNSSLMMSESELDSDQDTVFSRDQPVRSRVGAHVAATETPLAEPGSVWGVSLKRFKD